MAVANPCLRIEKRETEESRRKRWRGRIYNDATVELSDGEEEDKVEEEGKDASCYKKVNGDEGKKEAGEPDGEMEAKRDHKKRKEDEEQSKWVGEANKSKDTDEEDDKEWDNMECEEVDEDNKKQMKKVDKGHVMEGDRREETGKVSEGKIDLEEEKVLDERQGDENEEGEHWKQEQNDTFISRKQVHGSQFQHCQQSKENREEKAVKGYNDKTYLDSPQAVCTEEDYKHTEEQNQDKLNHPEKKAWRIENHNFQEEPANDVLSEDSTDENENYLEDEVKVYHKDDYPSIVFLALKKFRHSLILTDLTLNTMDGRSVCVHSTVLAAVSTFIWIKLDERTVENRKVNERKPVNPPEGAHDWSVSLDPEVDYIGLEAIVEFAYTGLIACLSEDNVHQIQTAARKLFAPRVLALCDLHNEKATKPGSNRKELTFSATKQLTVNLESIKQLWMDRVGCDIRLKAPGGSCLVHRVILAASSDYFRGMFTLGMKESLQSCVSLPFLLASDLEVMIGSSYSGALSLSWTNAFEIASMSLQLQYQPALSLCFSFLHREINARTCLDVVSFAEAYEMAHLLEAAEDFVLRQFQEVTCTAKFKDLPAKQLLKYLNSTSLCVASELVVFNAVILWIQSKPNRRLKFAEELMKSVQFSLMTFKEFKEVQAQNIWCDPSLAELYKKVFEDFCCNDTPPQSQCRIYLPKESLILIGGDHISEDLCNRSISRDIWFGNSMRSLTGINKAIEWRRLGEMPESPRFSHEVAVLNGQLYIFGGKKYYGMGDTFNSVYRYDQLQNSWESLCEMQEKRSYFSVVVLDGQLYAVGGFCEPDHMDTVECYCPATNSWSFTRPLALPMSGHVARVFKGQIFVSGGQNTDQMCLSSMLLYHPETGSTYLASMRKPRAHHIMETLGEHLYVAGGITTNDNMAVIDQLACEMYSPAANSWTAFTSLRVPHVGAGSTVLEGKLYVLGGYSLEDYSDTNMVHRYDTTTQKWENIGQMPGPNNEIRACVLHLPQHLRL